MRQSECFELGIVARLHGYQGQVQIVIESDDASRYRKLDAVFVEVRGQLVPYIIQKIDLNGNRAIVKFQDVDSEEEALKLKAAKLFLPLSFLPTLADNQFYFHEIVGYTIEDKDMGTLGTVTTTYSMPTQDLVGMDYKGVEVLIPIADDIILKVDRANMVLHTDLPLGLVDVYLEQDDAH